MKVRGSWEGAEFLITDPLSQVVGNGSVVAGSVLKGLHSQIKPRRLGCTAIRCNLRQHAAKVFVAHKDGHIAVILGCRSHHGGAAYIDIFNGVSQRAVWVVDGRFKGIKVDDNKVDRRDLIVRHDLVVFAASAENPAVDFWM